MSIIPKGAGSGGKPYTGENPIIPDVTDKVIDKNTLLTQPLTIKAIEDITPEIVEQTPLVTEILESLVGKVTLANATPETILEGYSAYVGQQLIKGRLENLSRKIDFGEVTLTAASSRLSISHNLGVVPSYVFVVSDGVWSSQTLLGVFSPKVKSVYNSSMDGAAVTITATKALIEFPSYDSTRNWRETTHRWIAMA